MKHTITHLDRPALARTLAILAIAALMMAGCATSSDSTDHMHDSANPEGFVEMFRLMNIDSELFESPQHLAADADLVATGRVVRVEEGRRIAPAPEADPVFLHVVMTVEVDQLLSGDTDKLDDGVLYVEIMKPSYLTAGDYREAYPKDLSVLWFLDDRTDVKWDGPILDNFAGRNADAPVYSPYADGVIVELPDGGFESAYLPVSSFADGWRYSSTFDSLVQSLSAYDGNFAAFQIDALPEDDDTCITGLEHEQAIVDEFDLKDGCVQWDHVTKFFDAHPELLADQEEEKSEPFTEG